MGDGDIFLNIGRWNGRWTDALRRADRSRNERLDAAVENRDRFSAARCPLPRKNGLPHQTMQAECLEQIGEVER